MKKNFTLLEILDQSKFYIQTSNVLLDHTTGDIRIHVEVSRYLTDKELIDLQNVTNVLLTQEARSAATREWEAQQTTPIAYTIDFIVKAADVKARIKPKHE